MSSEKYGFSQPVIVFQVRSGQPVQANLQKWISELTDSFRDRVNELGYPLSSISAPTMTPIGSQDGKPLWYFSLSGLVYITDPEKHGVTRGTESRDRTDGRTDADTIPRPVRDIAGYASTSGAEIVEASLNEEEIKREIERHRQAGRLNVLEGEERLQPFSGERRGGIAESGESEQVSHPGYSTGRFPDLRDL